MFYWCGFSFIGCMQCSAKMSASIQPWSWLMHFLRAWDCCKNWAHVQYEEMLQNTEKDENYLRSVVFMTGSKLSRHGLCNICRDSMRKELVAVCTMQTSWIATPTSLCYVISIVQNYGYLLFMQVSSLCTLLLRSVWYFQPVWTFLSLFRLYKKIPGFEFHLRKKNENPRHSNLIILILAIAKHAAKETHDDHWSWLWGPPSNCGNCAMVGPSPTCEEKEQDGVMCVK